MKQRLLLFILVLLSTLTSSAYNAEIDGVYYNLNTSTSEATVTSGDTKYTGSMNIPETVKYENVTYSVTSIGGYAFYKCSGLTSVTIPNSVTSIGYAAFEGCFFASDSFINNSSLTSQDNWGATICDEVTSDGLLIKNNSVIKCRPWATSVIIPNSVTEIGNSAFYGCKGLTSVTIPNSVTYIGAYAFSGCSGLTSVTIPNSVTSIEESSFYGCI